MAAPLSFQLPTIRDGDSLGLRGFPLGTQSLSYCWARHKLLVSPDVSKAGRPLPKQILTPPPPLSPSALPAVQPQAGKWPSLQVS